MTKEELILQLMLIGYTKTPNPGEGLVSYVSRHLNHRYTHITLPHVNLGLEDIRRFKCLKPCSMNQHVYINIDGGRIRRISKLKNISELLL